MGIKLLSSCISLVSLLLICCGCSSAQTDPTIKASVVVNKDIAIPKVVTIDSAEYKKRMQKMLNGDSSSKWKFSDKYPLAGALLPFNRIIAYYGNLYSTRMGILGELPKAQMFAKLKQEMKVWEKADPETPVIPALHYVVTTAQESPGNGGMYRLRMPSSQIEKVIAMAEEINAIVFLDIQVGLSTLEKEIPAIEQYLKNPKVHLGIDPEFSMKGGQRPGTVIGSFDASDVNYAANYLASLVKKYNLPPKILVLHRFTQGMMKDVKSIKLIPEVQFVMDMDGWGAPARKINTYKQFVYAEPLQFTGFKLFYKNDLKETPKRLLSPSELLALKPVPMYIQYQ
jgi:hypothetical protein